MALLLGGTNLAFAEESGGFLGVEIGYGAGEYEGTATITTTINSNYDGGGIKYGVVMGYKGFFTQYIG